MSIKLIVSLGFTALFMLFIIMGVIIGAIRGAKRSGLRLVTLALTLVATFLLTGVVTSLLLKLNVSFLHLSVNGTQATTLTEYIKMYLSDMLKNYNVSTTQVANIAIMISSMILNTIVFPLLFVVLRFVLLPLYWILARVLFGKRKQKDSSGEIKKRHGAVGAIIGAVSGFMIGTVVFTPVVGYINVASSIEYLTENSEGKGAITRAVGDKYNLVVDGYNSSPYYYISKYTGSQALSNIMFDSIATGKMNGKTIKVSKELKIIASAYKDFENVLSGLGLVGGSKEVAELTQEQLNTYVASMKNMLSIMHSSDLVMCVGDVAMSVAVEYLDNVDKSNMDTYTQSLISASVQVMKEYSFDDAFNMLDKTVAIASKLNDKKLLLPIIRRDSDTFNTLSANIDKAFAVEIMNDFFAIDIVSRTATEISNTMLSLMSNMLDIDFSAYSGVTNDVAKQALTDIVINFADALSGVNLDSWMYYNAGDMSKIGVFLDTLKNSSLITTETYNASIDKIENKLVDVIDGINIGDSVKNDLKQAVGRLSEVDNWTQEFTRLSAVASELNLALADENQKIKSGGIKEYDWTHLGKALDNMQGTTLFDYETGGMGFTKKLVSDAIDWVQTEKIGSFGSKIDATMTKIKTNVLGVTKWEDALGGAKDVITVLLDLADVDDVASEFKKASSTLASDLGQALDTADGTPLFVNNTVETFTLDLLNIVEDSVVTDADTAINRAITSAVDVMRDNINSAISASTHFYWEQEYTNFKTLFKSNFDELTLDSMTPIARNIDSIMALHQSRHIIITNEVINTLLKEVIDDALDNSLAQSTKDKYSTQIQSIKDAVPTLTGAVYERETTAISKLKNILTDVSTVGGIDHNIVNIDLEDLNQMAYFGGKFDEIRLSTVVGGLGYSIMGDELDSYTSDKASDPDYEFGTVLNIVRTHFDALNNGWQSSSDGATFYTRLFIAFNGVVTGMDISVGDKDQLQSNASAIESMLASKQNNILILQDGAKEIAQIALDKVQDTVESYQQDISDLPESTQKTDAQNKLNEILDYISNYSSYLNTSTDAQPYNSNTQTLVGTLQINKPFSHIAALASTLQDMIDNASV